MDAEGPFLCGKKTLEDWKFQLNTQNKALEVSSLTDGTMIQLEMVDTQGGHYGIVLETQKRNGVHYIEDAFGDEMGIIFLEDKAGELCSFKAVRQVHKVNRHKQKDQLLACYRNAGWLSPELCDTITRVIQDCKICQKFSKSVMRPKIALSKSRSFNEVVTLDLKEFGAKYILWMIDLFTRFMQGKLITNKKS